MNPAFAVTGTDTDVGKTVFAAALAGAIGAYYWKPIQAGTDPAPDSETVARLSGLPTAQILPEAYRLSTPCSPHRAAELEGIEIDPEKLTLPRVNGPLIVEGAGGVAVPLRADHLFIDQLAVWRIPVIVVARTALGTINHSLLTIEALRARGIAVHGIAFVGDPHQDSEEVIGRISGIRRLGRLPVVTPLNSASLSTAFLANFSPGDFR